MTGKHYYFLKISIVLIYILFSFTRSQTIEDEFDNPCTSAKTCGECIQISPVCAWCGAEIYSREVPRCDKLDNLVMNCDKSAISDPLSSYQIIREDELTSGGVNQRPVQIKPQEVEFVLRPNQQKRFTLKFQQQANYPVDLYFLLDLSYGMHRQAEARKRLTALGNDIQFIMTDITDNFRLGFGTFVDKELMPYTAWTDRMLKDRCPKENGQCRFPHDFKNQMSIGLNQSSFATNMKLALETVSQSLDDAEGGLDGLVQALDCDVIGWRDISRRIIVYSSNSLFHLAGSGKLGGATKQNHLKCNLTADGKYAGDKVYDYPSVSQIADILRRKKTNVIFAVMSDVAKHYRNLESFLDGAVVGELEDDSKNIVKLIKDKYYELRSRIQFQPSESTNVDVKFVSQCKGGVARETTVCENLEIMDSVEFNVTITASDEICLNKSGIVKKEILLNAIGLKETVIVTLNVQCSCDCEIQSRKMNVSSVKCSSGNGIFECGICNCKPGRFGRICECDESEISREESLELCRDDRNNNSLICSGNGECICGECGCLPIPGDSSHTFSGLYCGCNNHNCLRGQDDQMCGGPSKGRCRCGNCDCLPGWTGKKCECTTAEDVCVASNGELCNGVGSCQCGRCVCDASSGRLGPTCEDCLTCPSQCNEYVDCAQCRGFESGSYKNEEECDRNCNKYKIRKEKELPSGEGIRSCRGTDVDKCTFFFTYEYNTANEVVLIVQETKDCPKKLPLASIIGGTVAAIFLIPLILICIFIFFRNLKDREEYAKFLKDKDKAHWDTGANPLYKGPTTTFPNPNYQKSSDTVELDPADPKAKS